MKESIEMFQIAQLTQCPMTTMTFSLYSHQKKALENLKPGSILRGGVGSGKSITALMYYFTKIGNGSIKQDGVGHYHPMDNPIDLYIITTAKKRDDFDWHKELTIFRLEPGHEKPKIVIDSWNNIEKYKFVKNAFFIFDEQRAIGAGTWAKSFVKIAHNNLWILLSATPGDVWMDYIPVFIANRFYKNRTEFIRRHVVYSRYVKYPKVEQYLDIRRLVKLRDEITVPMRYQKPTTSHHNLIFLDYDKEAYNRAEKNRWNDFTNKPIKDIREMCYLLRRIVNTHPSRQKHLYDLYLTHGRIIVFYNFNYELLLLRNFAEKFKIPYSEWNGHKHQSIPDTNKWLYFVQYTAGAEGWNCVSTNAMIFFSQNYSYKATTQAAGRIDRINTPYENLHYYHFLSESTIDKSIRHALEKKRKFNESDLLYLLS